MTFQITIYLTTFIMLTYCKKCNQPLISTKKADRDACVLNCLQIHFNQTLIHPSCQEYVASVVFSLEYTNFLESIFIILTEGLVYKIHTSMIYAKDLIYQLDANLNQTTSNFIPTGNYGNDSESKPFMRHAISKVPCCCELTSSSYYMNCYEKQTWEICFPSMSMLKIIDFDTLRKLSYLTIIN